MRRIIVVVAFFVLQFNLIYAENPYSDFIPRDSQFGIRVKSAGITNDLFIKLLHSDLVGYSNVKLVKKIQKFLGKPGSGIIDELAVFSPGGNSTTRTLVIFKTSLNMQQGIEYINKTLLNSGYQVIEDSKRNNIFTATENNEDLQGFSFTTARGGLIIASASKHLLAEVLGQETEVFSDESPLKNLKFMDTDVSMNMYTDIRFRNEISEDSLLSFLSRAKSGKGFVQTSDKQIDFSFSLSPLGKDVKKQLFSLIKSQLYAMRFILTGIDAAYFADRINVIETPEHVVIHGSYGLDVISEFIQTDEIQSIEKKESRKVEQIDFIFESLKQREGRNLAEPSRKELDALIQEIRNENK